MWRIVQMVERLNILIHPLPEKDEELGLSPSTRDVAGSNPAPPPSFLSARAGR